MEFILLLIFSLTLLIEYFQNKSLFNGYFLVIGPYIIIALLNNYIMSSFGYEKLNTDSLYILFFGGQIFYAGMIACRSLLHSKKDRSTHLSDNNIESVKININIKIVSYYIAFVLLFRLFQIISIYRQGGIAYITNNDFEVMQLKGIGAHLELSIFPLEAIMLYEGIKQRKKIFFLLYFLGIVIAFSSFIKYHVIAYVMISYLYCSIKDKHLMKKMLNYIIVGILGLFVLNYYISFLLRNMQYAGNQYLYKIWNYIGGSSINANWVTSNLSGSYSSKDYMLNTFMTLPNLFFDKLIGLRVEGHLITMGFRSINEWNMTSNVIGVLYNIYLTNNIIFFVFALLVWGAVTELIVIMVKRIRTEKIALFASVYFTFNALSFFANYFTLVLPWELLIWSLLTIPIINLVVPKARRI
ncbi:DUF6337 family protein [Clostridium oryzae]|uniref:Oligosaccharide repeat unit polymerase n=1 Tax=Clostridium oryzae TaxID=1450648 RepID=A0A1V4IP44_9CLOT|nr:DUF6337 family protein [Clostridium oryzae]OPJ61649.1 hypothetical protein CLORY_21490 [Clostridium oryzae]